jgi:hypothetical protein
MGFTVANRVQPFHQHHVRRALKAAAAAGMSNPSVEVRLPSGATIAVSGAVDKPPRAVSPRAAPASARTAAVVAKPRKAVLLRRPAR